MKDIVLWGLVAGIFVGAVGALVSADKGKKIATIAFLVAGLACGLLLAFLGG